MESAETCNVHAGCPACPGQSRLARATEYAPPRPLLRLCSPIPAKHPRNNQYMRSRITRRSVPPHPPITPNLHSTS